MYLEQEVQEVSTEQLVRDRMYAVRSLNKLGWTAAKISRTLNWDYYFCLDAVLDNP
ncbi:MAG: hypothetical protein AAGJ18_27515 [Bacteroidota bacterium]